MCIWTLLQGALAPFIQLSAILPLPLELWGAVVLTGAILSCSIFTIVIAIDDEWMTAMMAKSSMRISIESYMVRMVQRSSLKLLDGRTTWPMIDVYGTRLPMQFV